jgi:hypothetical protein
LHLKNFHCPLGVALNRVVTAWIAGHSLWWRCRDLDDWSRDPLCLDRQVAEATSVGASFISYDRLARPRRVWPVSRPSSRDFEQRPNPAVSTLELIAGQQHNKVGSANPTVRTRKQRLYHAASPIHFPHIRRSNCSREGPARSAGRQTQTWSS